MKIKTYIAVKICSFLLLIFFIVGTFVNCGLFNNEEAPGPSPHLISEAEIEANPVRPVLNDENAVQETIIGGFPDQSKKIYYQLEHLISILQCGNVPRFNNDTDERVIATYEAAIEMLNKNIRNDMTDFERVHIIHDWITYNIKYDYDLYDLIVAGLSNDAFSPSHSASGVFLNDMAVCDGYSKAFVLLCGIEKIRAVRVSGNFIDSEYGHAWNKVYIDGKWYNVDITADKFNIYYINTKTRKTYLSHSNFLLSDKTLNETHIAKDIYDFDEGYVLSVKKDDAHYVSAENYDYYGGAYLYGEKGEQSSLLKINSQDELNALFIFVKKNKRAVGKFEVQITFITAANTYENIFKKAFNQVSGVYYSSNTVYMRANNTFFVFLY